MLFAVIGTGGKQYRVEKGSVLKLEKLDNSVGDNVSFDEVLFLHDGEKDFIGSPIVAGAKVSAEVIYQIKDKKIEVFKKKRRKGYQKVYGHRQRITIVKVKDIYLKTAEIKGDSKSTSKATKKANTDVKVATKKKATNIKTAEVKGDLKSASKATKKANTAVKVATKKKAANIKLDSVKKVTKTVSKDLPKKSPKKTTKSE